MRREEERRLQAIEDERVRREKERLLKQAENLKTPELKMARLEKAEAIAAPVVRINTAPSKVSGVATRKTWKARVVDFNKVPRKYMLVNTKALDALARATKGNIEVPGVEFFEESSLSIR